MDTIKIQERILLKRAIYEKDRYAQEYIYIKYNRFLHQFIKARGKGNFDGYVDDLVQEVFVNICTGKCQYSGNTDVRGYLCGIAKNVVKHHINIEKRKSSCYSNYRCGILAQSERRVNIINDVKHHQFDRINGTLQQVIAKLPRKSREAVELVLIHKMEPYQAAKKLGCSSVVFRNRLYRGLKRLRKKYRDTSNFSRI